MSQRYDVSLPSVFPSGVSTRLQTHPLGQFPYPDPFLACTVYDNFTDMTGEYTTIDLENRWLLTETGTSIVELVDGQDGILSLTTDNGVTDAVGLRTPKKPFLPDNTSNLWCYGRFNLSSATESIFDVGFQGTTYQLAIYKALASGQLYLRVKTPTLAVTNFPLSPRAVVVDDTFFTVGFFFRWITGALIVYFNDSPDRTFRLPNAPTDTPAGFRGGMPEELQYGYFNTANDGTNGNETVTLVDFVLFSQLAEPGQVYGG